MKTIRVVIIVMRILILVLTGLFVYMALSGTSGSTMTTNGLILLGLLLCTRYLAKLYDSYMQTYQTKHGGEASKPLEIRDSWGFDPINYLDGRFDFYVNELANFVASSDNKAVFIPSKKQQFQVWWHDYAQEQYNLTGQITKISHTADHRILLETTSGMYIGKPEKCADVELKEIDEGQHSTSRH